MLGHDVHRHLRQIHVGADAGRGGDARLRENVTHDGTRHLVRAHAQRAQIGRGIDEHLIDRIDMDVLGRGISQVHAVHPAAHLQVMRHSRLGDHHRRLQSRGMFKILRITGFTGQPSAGSQHRPLGVHRCQALPNLEQTCASGNAIRLQRRRHGQADGLVRTLLIRHHQMRAQRVETTVATLHGSVKRLQVYGKIHMLAPNHRHHPLSRFRFRVQSL